MSIWHLTWSALDRPTLFPGEDALLRAGRKVARCLGDRGLLYCVVDDHVHAVVRGTRREAGLSARGVARGLNLLLGATVRLEPARIRAVHGRSHLESLVPYVLDQSTHHALQLEVHQAMWPGSCFQELVGARRTPGFDPMQLREALPRLSRDRVWRAVHLEPLEPTSDEALRAAGPGALTTAAAAAVGVPGYAGRSAGVVEARRVVARLGRQVGMSTADLAALTRCSPPALRRLAREPVPPALERAVRLQVVLRQACAANPLPRPLAGGRGVVPGGRGAGRALETRI